jgi:hypothetical protein
MIKKLLWRWLIKLEGFDLQSKVESVMVWQRAFHHVPELKDWLKRREIVLLQSTTLKDKSNDFILGQIAESRLLQSFDRPLDSTVKPYELPPLKIPDRSHFLKRWAGQSAAEPNAKKEKEIKVPTPLVKS